MCALMVLNVTQTFCSAAMPLFNKMEFCLHLFDRIGVFFSCKSNCFRCDRDKETGITFISGRLHCFVNYLFSVSTMPNTTVVHTVMVFFFFFCFLSLLADALLLLSVCMPCQRNFLVDAVRFHSDSISLVRTSRNTQHNTIPFSVCDSSFQHECGCGCVCFR